MKVLSEQNKGGGTLKQYKAGQSIDVKMNGDKVGVIDITNFYPGADKFNRNGIEIDLLYKDISSKLTKFNWIQTARTNDLTKNMKSSPLNDADDDPPFYNSQQEILQQEVPSGYAAKFRDFPNRYPKSTKNIFWEEELSLVGADISGRYHEMTTMRYGFKISKTGKLTGQYISLQNASDFQLYHINQARVGFFGAFWNGFKKYLNY